MTDILERIKQNLDVSTTVDDLFRIAQKKCNVFLYGDLHNFNSIQQLFKKGNSPMELQVQNRLPFDKHTCIMLYQTGPTYGHWTLLTKNASGINFLDSYGDLPDDQLQFIDSNFRKKSNQDYKHLINLLLKTRLPIFYNNADLQELSSNIATCGRYCAIYLKYDNINVDEFARIIKKLASSYDLSCDELVTLVTICD